MYCWPTCILSLLSKPSPSPFLHMRSPFHSPSPSSSPRPPLPSSPFNVPLLFPPLTSAGARKRTSDRKCRTQRLPRPSRLTLPFPRHARSSRRSWTSASRGRGRAAARTCWRRSRPV
ncbi:hypothetical protein ANANG_G00286910 [Anguilla anguilla]|uniref:Uncharacterized protein n=1 Tax=Anguilla anguilla TaxID=7936 RepID=A0A9D3LSS8_ANGAN|nr:hypothetical protein ANANG_G00286910 [Anguilla anguilla]